MRKLACVAMCGSLLVGCGGSSDSSNSSDELSAKINGTVDNVSHSNLKLGVNGHDLDASDATVSYEDQSYSFDTVITGMRVEISTLNGLAQSILLEPSATGQISALSADTVTVNGMTFSYSSSGLSVGDWVMVFAQIHPDGSWSVSALNQVDALLSAEIEGSLSALDENASTFMLGTVLIDYSNAAIEDNRSLADGMWVEVFGQFVDDKFVASFVDIRDNQDFNGLELEGVVTWVSDDKTLFEVAGHLLVSVTDSTVFDDGTINSLIIGAIVEVDLVQSGDAMFATRVDFENQLDTPDNLEFKVEGEGSYNNGDLSINGITFIIDTNTRFDGLTESSLNGNWLELSGKHINGQFMLKKIKTEQKDNEISLKGHVNGGVLWGYTALDNTLDQFEGQWVDVECQRSDNGNNSDLTLCRLDLN